MKILKFVLIAQLLITQNLICQTMEYLFHQQINNLPYLFAPLNFKKLNVLLDKNRRKILKEAEKETIDLEKKFSPDEKILIPDLDGKTKYYDFSLIDKANWHTITQWLGINNQYVLSWIKAFCTLNKNKKISLKRYLETCLKRGTSLPNFYTSRTPFIQKPEEFFFGSENHFSIIFWPYILVDKKAFDNAINIFQTQDKIKPSPTVKSLNLFKPTSLITLPLVTTHKNLKSQIKENQTVYTPRVWNYVQKYDTEKNKYLDLDFEPNQIFGLKLDEIVWFKSPRTATAKIKNRAPYFFSSYGIFNLALLKFGLDTDGQIIKIDKTIQDIDNKAISLLEVSKDVKNLTTDNNNPWNNQFFKKENLLQLAIVKIFKENPQLFELTKQAIDFDNQIKPFKFYQDFLLEIENNKEFYGKNGTEFDSDRVKQFLPDEKLTLAYLLTTIVGILWNGALNKNNLKLSFKKFVKNATEKRFNNQSFVDVWQQITKKLPPKNNWISMDLQPSVFSFDISLVNTQIIHILKFKNGKNLTDLILLKNLGCTLISSVEKDLLNVFYKRQKGVQGRKVK